MSETFSPGNANDVTNVRLSAPRKALLSLLASGEFRSGEALGEAVGMSRAAVWKHMEALQELGLDIHRVPGRGYRLAHPLRLLEPARIRDELPVSLASRCELAVLDTVDSTNAWLARQPDSLRADQLRVCVAEHQQSGRGRRGRQWQSPFGANLYFSVDWPFETLPHDFSALSLVVGVAARAALDDIGLAGVQLKWPNDLLFENRKLGGILLELRGEPPGPSRVVIGIGINVAMPIDASRKTAIDQPWIDLATAGLVDVDRNVLAAALLASLETLLGRFLAQGFSSIHPLWNAADALAGKPVRLSDGARNWDGVSRGVAADGALLVELSDGEKRFFAGDVSLRERP